MVFKDLRYTVQVEERDTKKTVSRDILKGLNGVVQPGRLTAVMGASGAGKVCLGVGRGVQPNTHGIDQAPSPHLGPLIVDQAMEGGW